MNPDFREIGPGIAFGSYLGYNAEMVTEDFACTAMPAGTIPVCRFWSDTLGGHFYAASTAERDKLISKYRDTWIYEGSVFSVYAEGQQPAGTLPVFRFWSNTYGHHFHTLSPGEHDKLINRLPNVWTYELIAWYTYPYPA